MIYSKEKPAKNIFQLTSFLKQEETRSKKTYAYRGQEREYDLPLIPSAYREFIRKDIPPISKKKLFPDSGDTIANIFMPMGLIEFTTLLVVYRIHPDILSEIDPTLAMPNTDVGIESLKSFARHLLEQAGIGGTQEEIFASGLQKGKHQYSSDKYGIIDRVCRHIIKEKAAVLPFGRVIGEFLCQQYGLTSGYLDATFSVDVAAFFSTHQSPLFLPPLAHNGVGIIYRFDISDYRNGRVSSSGARDDPYLFSDTCFNSYENDRCNYSTVHESLNDFLAKIATLGEIDKSVLKVPIGSLAMSRIGRQKSVMIVPAVVVQEVDTWGKSIVGVEDLQSRPGVEKFYFLHDAHDNSPTHISRNWIWPSSGDVFKTWTAAMFLPNSPNWTGPMSNDIWISVPKRADLIDTGYTIIEGCKPNLSYLNTISRSDVLGIDIDRSVTDANRAKVSNIIDYLIPIFSSEIYIWDEQIKLNEYDFKILETINFQQKIENDLDFLSECIDAPSGSDLQSRTAALLAMGLYVLQANLFGGVTREGIALALEYFITAIEISELLGYTKISLASRQVLAGFVSQIVIRSQNTLGNEKDSILLSCLDVLDEMLTVETWQSGMRISDKITQGYWHRIRQKIVDSLDTSSRVALPNRLATGTKWGLGNNWEDILQLLSTLQPKQGKKKLFS